MPHPYGAPLHCPKCPAKSYYGVLKLQGGPKMLRCPNCNTLLVNIRRHARFEPELNRTILELDAIAL